MLLIEIFQHVQFRQPFLSLFFFFFLNNEKKIYANPYALKYLNHPVPICLKILSASAKKICLVSPEDMGNTEEK